MAATPTTTVFALGLILLMALGGLILTLVLVRSQNLRFSLASLLLFVLAASIVCGGVAFHFRTVSRLQDQLAMEREKALDAMAQADRERARAELYRVQAHQSENP